MTGILPIALEGATKVVQAILLSGKEYVCVMRLHSQVSEDRIKDVLDEFCGTIYQRPPVRASVKRRLRIRKIYYLNLLEMDGKNVLFRVGCEAGTYIRKLCHDLGEVLGCGSHMRELRRTKAGPFLEDEGLVTLHDISFMFTQWQETNDEGLLRKFIYPMEKALKQLPKIYIRDSGVLHYLLGVAGERSLLESPKRGSSWEGFMIEQVMKAIMNVCDRIIVLHHGKKIAEGTPQEIATSRTVVEVYLGE